MDASPSATCSKAEFARRLGYKPSYVTELRKAGRLVMDGDQVRVAESLARIAATRDPGKEGVAARHAAARAAAVQAPAPAEEDGREGLDAAAEEVVAYEPGSGSDAERRAKAMADDAEESARYKRLKNDMEEGLVLKRDRVLAGVAQAYAQTCSALEASSHDLAAELAPITDVEQVRAILNEAHQRILSQLSRDLAASAQRVAA